MNGKSKCKILKDIRKQIAADNDISYVTSECKHQGDCLGTCPKCEAEVQYLENELRKRQSVGKVVAVAGIAAALMLGGCSNAEPADNSTTASTPVTTSSSSTVFDPLFGVTEPTEDGELGGDPIVTPEDYEDVMGEVPVEDELMGEPTEEAPNPEDNPVNKLPVTDAEDPFYEQEPGVDTEDKWGTIH